MYILCIISLRDPAETYCEHIRKYILRCDRGSHEEHVSFDISLGDQGSHERASLVLYVLLRSRIAGEGMFRFIRFVANQGLHERTCFV